MMPTYRRSSGRRFLHSSAVRNQEEDDNPWGDLDKAFDNLQDKSLYQQVYNNKSLPSASHTFQATGKLSRGNVTDMEEAIFAQAGAASVPNQTQPRSAVTRGVQFSDVPPNANLSDGMSQRWSEYMQDGAEIDDSPWASLDAFADNPEASARFAVPLATHQRPSLPSERETTREVPRVERNSVSAAEEAMFARAGAASVSSSDPQSTILTHLDPVTGQAAMVDVGTKPVTARSATATGRVYMPTSAADLIRQTEGSTSGVSGKGPVLHTAQLAGIMGAKRTADLIPLCHTLALSKVDVQLEITELAASEESCILVTCTAKTASQTGVEMEALTGCMTACLTVWDMTKAIAGKTMRISDVKVVQKSGGQSGDWTRED